MLCLMQVILSEGDLSSLANMKLNLELNQLNKGMDDPGSINQDPNLVSLSNWNIEFLHCIFLSITREGSPNGLHPKCKMLFVPVLNLICFQNVLLNFPA